MTSKRCSKLNPFSRMLELQFPKMFDFIPKTWYTTIFVEVVNININFIWMMADGFLILVCYSLANLFRLLNRSIEQMVMKMVGFNIYELK